MTNSSFDIPQEFGPYTLEKRIARGGMADIFLARRRGELGGFEKRVAIKRIFPHLTDRDETVRMFFDEARIAATLHHPNIVQIYDLGEQDGFFYMAMEFVQGTDVRRLCKRGIERDHYLSYELAAYIVSKVAAGLHYAHTKTDDSGDPCHIIHRDISPQNILLSVDGHVKICDFGIVKAKDRLADTHTGEFKGKTSYMSPEQFNSEEIDARSDIFNMGIVLYEVALARRLFEGESDYERMRQIAEAEVTPPSEIRSDVPTGLERIIMRALEADPDARFQTAEAMRTELERWLHRRRQTTNSMQLASYIETVYPELLEGPQNFETLEENSSQSSDLSALHLEGGSPTRVQTEATSSDTPVDTHVERPSDKERLETDADESDATLGETSPRDLDLPAPSGDRGGTSRSRGSRASRSEPSELSSSSSDSPTSDTLRETDDIGPRSSSRSDESSGGSAFRAETSEATGAEDIDATDEEISVPTPDTTSTGGHDASTGHDPLEEGESNIEGSLPSPSETSPRHTSSSPSRDEPSSHETRTSEEDSADSTSSREEETSLRTTAPADIDTDAIQARRRVRASVKTNSTDAPSEPSDSSSHDPDSTAAESTTDVASDHRSDDTSSSSSEPDASRGSSPPSTASPPMAECSPPSSGPDHGGDRADPPPESSALAETTPRPSPDSSAMGSESSSDLEADFGEESRSLYYGMGAGVAVLGVIGLIYLAFAGRTPEMEETSPSNRAASAGGHDASPPESSEPLERVSVPIETTPEGASVIVNSRHVEGTTPGTFPLVRDASNEVIVFKKGYRPLHRMVSSDEHDSLSSLELEETRDGNAGGRLVVKSQPRGATIYLDGRKVGETPFERESLSAGTLHHVRLVEEGRHPFIGIVEIAENRKTPVIGRLARDRESQADPHCSVIYDVVPSGTSVRVNGEFRGRTRVEVESPYRSHLAIELEHDEHEPRRHIIATSREATYGLYTSLDDLERADGTVVLKVPDTYRVFIGRNAYGRGSIDSLTLPADTYEAIFETPDRTRYRATLEVEPRSTVTYRFQVREGEGELTRLE